MVGLATVALQTTTAEIEAKPAVDRAKLLDVTGAPDNPAVVYLRSGDSGAMRTATAAPAAAARSQAIIACTALTSAQRC